MCAATTNKRKNVGLRRVELQLNRKFLRVYGIPDVFAFQKLIQVLPGRHFYFAKLDMPKVLQHLRNAGHDSPGIRRILERVEDAEGNLHAQCTVLRKRGKLKNVRRLLIPLDTNKLVRKALKNCLAKWQEHPGESDE